MMQRLAILPALASLVLLLAGCGSQSKPRSAQEGGGTQSTASCLSYEPTVVSVVGRLGVDTFPGRPNYESIKAGDEPESEYVLHLTQPICVQAGAGDPTNSDESGVDRLQVLVDNPLRPMAKGLIGSRVVITGTLFGAVSGHHHTRVLITATGIRAA